MKCRPPVKPAALANLAIPAELLPLAEAFLDALAERVAAKLTVQTATRYADCESNPYGASRPFLDAARAGAFPTFLRVRRITALWSDCEAAIQSRTRKPRTPKLELVDEDRAELERAGVTFRKGARS